MMFMSVIYQVSIAGNDFLHQTTLLSLIFPRLNFHDLKKIPEIKVPREAGASKIDQRYCKCSI